MLERILSTKNVLGFYDVLNISNTCRFLKHATLDISKKGGRDFCLGSAFFPHSHEITDNICPQSIGPKWHSYRTVAYRVNVAEIEGRRILNIVAHAKVRPSELLLSRLSYESEEQSDDDHWHDEVGMQVPKLFHGKTYPCMQARVHIDDDIDDVLIRPRIDMIPRNLSSNVTPYKTSRLYITKCKGHLQWKLRSQACYAKVAVRPQGVELQLDGWTCRIPWNGSVISSIAPKTYAKYAEKLSKRHRQKQRFS